MSTIKKPNLFEFATSELSQDAFVSWLLQWSDSSCAAIDSELNILGKKFLSFMTRIPVEKIINVEVGRQWENIDIWIEINDDTFVVIEDKTGTSEHDNQLERYKSTAEDYYAGKRDKFYYIYLKTGNEPSSTHEHIASKGYRVITRKMILNVLSSYTGKNDILIDFMNHLCNIENETNSFKTKQIKDWSWYAWQGFYMELEKWYEDMYWEYVANPSGGFLGAWWNFINSETDDVKMYFQIEQGKFCFKISCGDNISDPRDVRQSFYETLLENADKHNIKVIKPQRFGNGYTMTVGIIEHPFEYFSESNVKAMLDTCCEVIKECVEGFDNKNKLTP